MLRKLACALGASPHRTQGRFWRWCEIEAPRLSSLGAGHAPLAGAKAALAHELAEVVQFEKHDGRPFAPLPVLTLRLDPGAGTWDCYMFDRLIAVDLPLEKTARPGVLTLTGGASGAWLLGLVSSDENPLFEDANRNGIEDGSERKSSGGLLTAGSARAQRVAALEAFRTEQRAKPFKSWRLRRIQPAR